MILIPRSFQVYLDRKRKKEEDSDPPPPPKNPDGVDSCLVREASVVVVANRTTQRTGKMGSDVWEAFFQMDN